VECSRQSRGGYTIQIIRKSKKRKQQKANNFQQRRITAANVQTKADVFFFFWFFSFHKVGTIYIAISGLTGQRVLQIMLQTKFLCPRKKGKTPSFTKAKLLSVLPNKAAFTTDCLHKLQQ